MIDQTTPPSVTPLKFLSICSGIEAASVAFAPLGWEAVAFSEIEPFPCAVLAHHYPYVPNLGDMTKFDTWPEEIFLEADLIVGGPPCQAFSVAGNRAGLADDRGNLTLVYVQLINHADLIRKKHGKEPVIAFYENVPGIFSDKTNAYGCLLGALAAEDGALLAPGGKWTDAGCVSGPQRAMAWRLFDAQYFSLAQRRRRVFLVASARDGFDPSEILFEREGVRRDSAPSREARQEVAGITRAGFASGSEPELMATLCAKDNEKWGCNQWVNEGKAVIQPIALAENPIGRQPQNGGNGDGFTVAGPMYTLNATGVHGVAQPIPFDTTQITSPSNYSKPQAGDPCHPLAAGAHPPAIAQPMVLMDQGGSVMNVMQDGTVGTLRRETHGHEPSVLTNMAVRRLLPEECESLQGFPRGYTNIPWRKQPTAPDGPRYKALGNSWAVPNVRWIGARIDNYLKQLSGDDR